MSFLPTQQRASRKARDSLANHTGQTGVSTDGETDSWLMPTLRESGSGRAVNGKFRDGFECLAGRAVRQRTQTADGS